MCPQVSQQFQLKTELVMKAFHIRQMICWKKMRERREEEEDMLCQATNNIRNNPVHWNKICNQWPWETIAGFALTICDDIYEQSFQTSMMVWIKAFCLFGWLISEDSLLSRLATPQFVLLLLQSSYSNMMYMLLKHDQRDQQYQQGRANHPNVHTCFPLNVWGLVWTVLPPEQDIVCKLTQGHHTFVNLSGSLAKYAAASNRC